MNELKVEPDKAQSCPVGIISIEQFDTGMDEVKRMYALVVTENEALLGLRDVLKQLENYPFGGHVPPEMRKLASDALAALPENLK